MIGVAAWSSASMGSIVSFERLGDEDVLLRGGEDIMATHLRLQDLLMHKPTLVLKVFVCFFLLAQALGFVCLLSLDGLVIVLTLEV